MTKAADTPKTAPAAKAPKAVVLCGCGCKEPVVRSFKQGHDQKLVAKLAADLVEGTGRGLNLLPKEDAGLDIQIRIDRVTAKVRERFSDGLAAKVHNAAMTAWANLEKTNARRAAKAERAKSGSAKPRKAAAKSASVTVPVDEPTEDASATGTQLGAEVQIKVNRYTYHATVTGMNQAGKVTAVTYLNNAGDERTITDPAKIRIVG